MVPDYAMIGGLPVGFRVSARIAKHHLSCDCHPGEISFYAFGFEKGRHLAKKMATISERVKFSSGPEMRAMPACRHAKSLSRSGGHNVPTLQRAAFSTKPLRLWHASRGAAQIFRITDFPPGYCPIDTVKTNGCVL